MCWSGIPSRVYFNLMLSVLGIDSWPTTTQTRIRSTYASNTQSSPWFWLFVEEKFTICMKPSGWKCHYGFLLSFFKEAVSFFSLQVDWWWERNTAHCPIHHSGIRVRNKGKKSGLHSPLGTLTLYTPSSFYIPSFKVDMMMLSALIRSENRVHLV